MALFDTLGSTEWDVSEVGQKLCQSFDEDNIRRKKHKVKNKIKKVIKCNIESSDKSGKMINGTTRLLKKLRKKLNTSTLPKNEDDKTPLNASISSLTYKNRLKRKRSLAFKESEVSSKKAKKRINGHTKAGLITNDQKISTSERHTFEDELTVHQGHSKKRKKKKQKNAETVTPRDTDKNIDPLLLRKRKEQLQQLRKLVPEKEGKNSHPKKQEPVLTLRQKMMKKLKAARFRFLNEQIYTMTSKESEEIFKRDPEAFKAYHEGYKLQVKKWPLNPLDIIIDSVSKMNKTHIIADFGCGEAKLAKFVEQKVHSFDLVAVNETVTACDMAHVPLRDSSVDVAVFCLSLMGTNLKDYLMEANRVLKQGGLLKIAEVESRFEDINAFIKSCSKFGFKKTWMDLSYNLFYFIDFKKVANIKDTKKLPSITLQPCLYKKR